MLEKINEGKSSLFAPYLGAVDANASERLLNSTVIWRSPAASSALSSCA
jgi:hypothetical protein